MMKRIYRIIKASSFGFKPEKPALFVHMAVWFSIGAFLAACLGWITGTEAQGLKDLAVAAGSILSLGIGYVGGMLWLVNRT